MDGPVLVVAVGPVDAGGGVANLVGDHGGAEPLAPEPDEGGTFTSSFDFTPLVEHHAVEGVRHAPGLVELAGLLGATAPGERFGGGPEFFNGVVHLDGNGALP